VYVPAGHSEHPEGVDSLNETVIPKNPAAQIEQLEIADIPAIDVK
jgi:hypothetical protein